MKRFVCLFVCMALCFMNASPAYAMHITADDEAKIVTNIAPEPILIPGDEAKQFDVYEVNLQAIHSDFNLSNCNAIDSILGLCEEKNRVVVANNNITVFEPTLLAQYITQCEEITDISLSNGKLYIFYIGLNEEHVILCYNENGMCERNIYDEKTDLAILTSAGQAYLYKDFRKGSYYEMNDAMIAQIDELRNEERWEEIDNISGIQVICLSDGTHVIEPEQDALPTSAGATSQAQLLADLKESFPSYTKKYIKGYSKYCDALDSHVFVSIYESRDGYTRETVASRFFDIGSTVASIGSYLSISKLSNLYGLLGALGVLYDVNDLLLEAVTLYRSAIYSYSFTRYGYAFDSTVYNKNVRVVEHGSGGKFTGGYDANDDFVWVKSLVPTAENYGYDSIANTTIYNYNADIAMHQYCITYYPD